MMWPFKSEYKAKYIIMIFHPEKGAYLAPDLMATSDAELALQFDRITDAKDAVRALKRAGQSASYVKIKVDEDGTIKEGLL